jgi:hypothetical protein
VKRFRQRIYQTSDILSDSIMDIWSFKPNQPEQTNQQQSPRSLNEKVSLTDIVKAGLPQLVTGSRAGMQSQSGQFLADLMAEAERRVRAAETGRHRAGLR